MNHAIEIKDLTVELPGFTLERIDLNIPKGVVVGLIGRNGAGKTTLLKAITDVYIPASGEVRYDGLPLRGSEAEVKGKLGIVYDSLFYPASMKAKRIARMLAPLYPDFDMDKWHGLMSRFGLDENVRPARYSKGMQMKFMLAMVLARDPDILILDEPTAGMDPAARAELMELIQDFMQDENKTVLFSTHITGDLDKIADYIALIEGGRLVLMEEKDTLLERYALVQVETWAMTEALRRSLIGVKQNAFGYLALTRDRSAVEGIPGVRLSRPAIEDLLIYGGGDES